MSGIVFFARNSSAGFAESVPSVSMKSHEAATGWPLYRIVPHGWQVAPLAILASSTTTDNGRLKDSTRSSGYTTENTTTGGS